MSWSSRRRTIYFSLFSIVILLVFSLLFYLFFYDKPTCVDGKQNQDEQGIDCGGICPIVCNFETADPIVLWSRSFQVSNNIYNIFSLVENPNFKVRAYNVPYSFKIYDGQNILIQERRGKIDILPRSIIPIFERTVDIGNRIPVRTLFEFTEKPIWIETSEEQPNLTIKNKKLSNLENNPRLTATIENKTVNTIKNIETTAIIFDRDGNALNISQTIINSLSKGESEDIVFTWSEVFEKEPVRIEIIPLVK